MNSPSYDPNGQPISPFPRQAHNNLCKSLDQLVGVCLGILADDVVNGTEARKFVQWVEDLYQVDRGWPFSDLRDRVSRIMSDGVISDAEREDLALIMRRLCGAPAEAVAEPGSATGLPLDEPEPHVLFPGHQFVVTGRFAFGTREVVHDAIESKGGEIGARPTLDTAYLVIGAFASRDWIHTTYGRKIERAVELRSENSGISIISEKHWRNFILI